MNRIVEVSPFELGTEQPQTNEQVPEDNDGRDEPLFSFRQGNQQNPSTTTAITETRIQSTQQLVTSQGPSISNPNHFRREVRNQLRAETRNRQQNLDRISNGASRGRNIIEARNAIEARNPIEARNSIEPRNGRRHFNEVRVQVTNPYVDDNIERESETYTLDDDDEEMEVSSLLWEIILVNMSFQIFFLLIIIHFQWGLDHVSIFIFLWIIDLRNLTKLLLKWLHKRRKALSFNRQMISFLDNTISCVYKVLIYLYFQERLYKAVFPFLLLVIMFLLRAFITCYIKFVFDRSIVTECIDIGFRLFVYLQICMVSLKLDTIIMWDWKDVFWSYWVFFSVMIGITLGFGIILIGKIYQNFVEKVDKHELRGLCWLFFISIGITVNSAITVSVVVGQLNTDASFLQVINSLSYLFLYSFFIIGYSFYFREGLKKFLEKIGTEDMEEDDRGISRNEISSEISALPPQGLQTIKDKLVKVKKKLKVERNPALNIFPQFLAKYSSTYFKTVNTSFISKQQALSPLNTKKEQVKKKQEEVKTPTKKSRSFIMHDKRDEKKEIQLSNDKKNLKYNIIDEINSTGGNNLFSFRPDDLNQKKPILTKEKDKENSSMPLNEVLRTAPQFILQDEKNVLHSHYDSNPTQNDIEKDHNKERMHTAPIQSEKLSKSWLPPRGFNINDLTSNNNQLEKSVLDDKSVFVENKGDNSVNACLICFDQTPNAVYMDCGHGGICYDCAVEIFQKTGECYLCRREILQVLQLDLTTKKNGVIQVISSVRMVTQQSDCNTSRIDASNM